MDKDNNNNYQYDYQEIKNDNLDMNLRINKPVGNGSNLKDKKVNILSSISLAMFVVPIIISIIMKLSDSKEFMNSREGSAFIAILFFIQLASLVFSIFINEKYPNTTLGRVVLIIISGSYFLMLILLIIMVPFYFCSICTKIE